MKPNLWPKCVEGVARWNAGNGFFNGIAAIATEYGWTGGCKGFTYQR